MISLRKEKNRVNCNSSEGTMEKFRDGEKLPITIRIALSGWNKNVHMRFLLTILLKGIIDIQGIFRSMKVLHFYMDIENLQVLKTEVLREQDVVH